MRTDTYFNKLLSLVDSKGNDIDTTKKNVIQEIERQKKCLKGRTMLPVKLIDEIIQTLFEFEKNITNAKNINDIIEICKSQILSLFIEQPVRIEKNDRGNLKKRMYNWREILQRDMLVQCDSHIMTFEKIRKIINRMIKIQKSKLKGLKLLPLTITKKIDNFFEEAENTINSVKDGEIDDLKNAIKIIYSDEFEYIKENTNEESYIILESSIKRDENYSNEDDININEDSNKTNENDININEDVDYYIKNLFGTMSSDEDTYLSDRISRSISDRIIARIYGANGIMNMMISLPLKNKIKTKLEELGSICTQRGKTVREIKDEIRSNWMGGGEITSDNEKEGIDLVKFLGSNWKKTDKEEIGKKFETRIAEIEGKKDETKRENGENTGMPIPKRLKDAAISQLIRFKEMFDSKNYDEIEKYFSSSTHKEISVLGDTDHQIEESQDNNLASEIELLITKVNKQINSETIIEINKQVELFRSKYDKKILDNYINYFDRLDEIIVKYVKGKIKLLPDSPGITIGHKEKIEELENLYECLTDKQKSLLGDCYAKYHLIKNKFREVSQRNVIDNSHVKLLEKDIAALPNPLCVSIRNSDQIERVLKEYEELGRRLQNQIKFEYLEKLFAVKNALLIASISDLIVTLPDDAENTLMYEELIHAVSEKYEGLPKSVQKEIFNRQKLFDVQRNLLEQKFMKKIYLMTDMTKYKIEELKSQIINEYKIKYIELLNRWKNEKFVYDTEYDIDSSNTDLGKILESIILYTNLNEININYKETIYFTNKKNESGEKFSYRGKLVSIVLKSGKAQKKLGNVNDDDNTISFFMIDDVEGENNGEKNKIKIIDNKYYINLKDRKEMLDKIDNHIQKCGVNMKGISSMDRFLILTYFLKTLINDLLEIPNNSHLIYNEQDFINHEKDGKILLGWKNRHIF